MATTSLVNNTSMVICPVCGVSVSGTRRTICPHCGNFYNDDGPVSINPARLVSHERCAHGKIASLPKRNSSSRLQSLANFFQNLGPGRRHSIDSENVAGGNTASCSAIPSGITGQASAEMAGSKSLSHDGGDEKMAKIGKSATLGASTAGGGDAATSKSGSANNVNRMLNRSQMSVSRCDMAKSPSSTPRNSTSSSAVDGAESTTVCDLTPIPTASAPSGAAHCERLPSVSVQCSGRTTVPDDASGLESARSVVHRDKVTGNSKSKPAITAIRISTSEQFKSEVNSARESGCWDVVHEFLATTFSSCVQINKAFTVDPNKEFNTASDPGVNFDFLNLVYDQLVKLPSHIQKTVLKAIVANLLSDTDNTETKDHLRAYFLLIQNSQFAETQTYVIFAHLLKKIASLNDQDHHYLVHWFKHIRSQRFRMLIQRLHRFVMIRLFPPKPDELPAITRCTWWIPCTIQVLALLNAANNLWHPRLVSILEFYNKALDHIDLMAEYYTWQNPNSRHGFNFCQYPFVLSINAKRAILQRDSEQQMIVMARRSLVAKVQRRQLPDVTVLFLNLNVRRTHLVSDSLNEIASKQHDLKKKLKVTFSGEPGLDMGGLTKEWFQLLLRKIFRPEYGMFTYDSKSHNYWFHAASCDNYQEFNLVGVLLGLAVYNSIILDVHFPTVCYRKLLSPAVVPYDQPNATVGLARVGLNTLVEVMPDLYTGLKNLLEYEGNVEEDFGITFQVSHTEFGIVKTTALKDGGENITVTNDNRNEYAQLYAEHLLNRSVYHQFKAFYHGFHSVCASNALIMLCAEEIEMLVCGSPNLDMSQLRKVTKYDGYTSDHPTIKYFWSVVLALRREQQQRLLLFATGSDRVPVGGTAEMHFKITKVENVNMLPMAYTCFNQLILPAYTRKKTLKDKLLIVIQNAEGFGIE